MTSDITYQRELNSLRAEADAELRAEGLLSLASRQERDGNEVRASELYARLSDPQSSDFCPMTAARAESRGRALRGEGDFGDRFEIFSRHFFSQATDPALLLSMGVAGGIGSALRFGALGRLAALPANALTRGLGARALASAGALAFEAPAFTFSMHLGRRIFGEERGPSAPLGHELVSSYLMLGALKLSAGATAPWIESSASRPWLQSLGRQGTLLGGLMLAQRAEVSLGLRPATTASQALAESLGTLLHFHVSGRLSGSLFGPRYAEALQAMEIRGRMAPARRESVPWFSEMQPAFATAAALEPNRAVDAIDPLRGPQITQMAMPKDVAGVTEPARGRLGSGDYARQENSSVTRLAVEHSIRLSEPEFFDPEWLASRLSDKRNFTEADHREVQEQVRAYLNEGGLPSYALKHERVQSYLQRVWLNSRRSDAPFSGEAQATLAAIGAARVFLRDFQFGDGSFFSPSPFLRSAGLSAELGRDFYYLSDLGRSTGSFKERGALVEVRRAALEGILHVVTASHGNHGLAVALAAQKLGLRSTIVVPDTTPRVKIERLHELGATVVTTGEQPWRGYEEARDWALQYVFERNLFLRHRLELDPVTRYIHGFEDVIPGQGVAAYEMLDAIARLPEPQRQNLSRATFLIPTGGGGLAAGLATVLKAELPGAKVFGVLSEEAPAMHVSLIDGVRSEVFLNEKGLCDSGIGLTIPGARPYRILSELLDGTLPVSDPLVGEAMRRFHRHEGYKLEGGAATGLAAVLGGRLPELGVEAGSPIVTVLTGGNIDSSRHDDVLASREAAYSGPGSGR